jgi:exoribonuclease-2
MSLSVRNGLAAHAIVLGMGYDGLGWWVSSLTSNGTVWRHLVSDVTFVIPHIVPNALTSRAGTSEIATDRRSISARVALLKYLRTFETQAIETFASVKTMGVGSLYDRVCSPNEDEWSKISLSKATEMIFPKSELNSLTVFALHRHLMRLPKYFHADPVAHIITQMFRVRPLSHVREIAAVDEMRTTASAAIDNFVSKARPIMAENRRRARELRDQPPSSEMSNHEFWNKDDLLIMGFLLHALRIKRGTQTDPYLVSLTFLIRKLRPTASAMDDGQLHAILVDLGIIPPWQDVRTRTPDAELDLQPEHTSPKVKRQDAVVAKGLEARSNQRIQTAPLGLEDFYQTDMVDSLRHDFGDMPVYVIDDAEAEELDDGISIERIPSEPTSDWVHVHIADPTAVLPPSHVFAHEARKKLQSQYYLHRSWPMLPRSLTSGWLGLGTGAGNGTPERVMTFSFKVNEAGEIVDYAVRPGLVRNLHILSYDGVDLAMGIHPPRHLYPFGGEPPLPTKAKLTHEHLDNLQALEAVKKRLLVQRLTVPSFNTHIAKSELSISPKGLDDSPALHLQRTTFHGFPKLTYMVPSHELMTKGSRAVIAELMKCASRVASRFCRDRGIPAIRRTGQPVFIASENALSKLLSMRDDHGLVNALEVLRYGASMPVSEYALEPKMHWSLGVPEGEGYCWVTSPLRRYLDLTLHWQIKHALINPTAPPFLSEQHLRLLCRDQTAGTQSSSWHHKSHSRFWSMLFVQRWRDGYIPRDPERPDPLDSLVATCTRAPKWDAIEGHFSCAAQLDTLGIIASLRGAEKVKHLVPGQSLRVKFHDVRLGMAPMLEVAPE